MTTKLSGSLRMFMGAAIVLAVIIAGFLNRSAWLILLATPAFTALYALGKWDRWKLAWRSGGLKMILLSILVTMPIQLILVSVFFLFGLGASMLVGASTGLQVLTSADLVTAAVMFVFSVALAGFINVLEARSAGEAQVSVPAAVLSGKGQTRNADEEVELNIDPTPLTLQSFYVSPGYWKADALEDAMEGRGKPVVKKADAASEDDIAATEARLGFKLPEGLRDLYKVMDGGYVGWMYVPLKADPGPFYDDWRGAFSIDYSQLHSLKNLRTVKDLYEDFTDDPDEMPVNADKLVVLQARYQDMTLLDYSYGLEARVWLVDFDEGPKQSKDIQFPDFDSFFVELRREYPEKLTTGDRLLAYRKKPIGEYMPAQQPSEFWGSDPHVFANIAGSRKDGSEPKKKADDNLIAKTQTRLGVTLPSALVALWRYRNGGALAARHFQTSKAGEPYAEAELPKQLMPMEYFTTLADLSDRITWPDDELPLREKHAGAERLVILQYRKNEALLLDYRQSETMPSLLLVNDIVKDPLADAVRIDSFDILLEGLRPWKSAS
ncbi:SMI1/KNR4 family protein [Endobacterium cereale]|uniref:SMI1/KNR4 family protein n=1 Tax=Endobacterium cereale TaxID=2663029 RepID=UPI002B45A138|nr:SMI1/KNR4 family protein [Endobacterium cereale]MEB2842825.1 SMI1/KNR4 family protein [Endobacterium cereale]